MSKEVKILSQYGYIQKGNRYFLRRGPKTWRSQGFKSKQDFEDWFNTQKEKYGLDWRGGYAFKWKSLDSILTVVDKHGNEINKPKS